MQPTATESDADRLARTSLVFGALSFIPIVSLLTTAISVVSAVRALVKGTNLKAKAYGGMALAILGFCISPFILIAILRLLSTEPQPAPTEANITQQLQPD